MGQPLYHAKKKIWFRILNLPTISPRGQCNRHEGTSLVERRFFNRCNLLSAQSKGLSMSDGRSSILTEDSPTEIREHSFPIHAPVVTATGALAGRRTGPRSKLCTSLKLSGKVASQLEVCNSFQLGLHLARLNVTKTSSRKRNRDVSSKHHHSHDTTSVCSCTCVCKHQNTCNTCYSKQHCG